jgi:hypothetical protein
MPHSYIGLKFYIVVAICILSRLDLYYIHVLSIPEDM